MCCGVRLQIMGGVGMLTICPQTLYPGDGHRQELKSYHVMCALDGQDDMARIVSVG